MKKISFFFRIPQAGGGEFAASANERNDHGVGCCPAVPPVPELVRRATSRVPVLPAREGWVNRAGCVPLRVPRATKYKALIPYLKGVQGFFLFFPLLSSSGDGGENRVLRVFVVRG